MDKPSVKKIVNCQKGILLLTALWILVLISLLGTATLMISSNEYKNSMIRIKGSQAYYLAEAGLEKAIYQLKVNPGKEIAFSEQSDTGSIVVKQAGTMPDRITLEAIGKVGKYQKTLIAQLEIHLFHEENQEIIELENLHLTANEIFNQIEGNIYCGKNMTLDNGLIVAGDVYCIETLKLNNLSIITGNVYSTGSIYIDQNSDILGKIFITDLDNLYTDNLSLSANVNLWNGKAKISLINWKEK